MTSSQNKSHSVSLWTLVALIIGSTVGAGIFSLEVIGHLFSTYGRGGIWDRGIIGGIGYK